MNQTKLTSLTESCLNVGSGFIISYLLMVFVIGPVYGLNLDASDNLGITVIFTVISVARGYLWRRYFANL